jgi:hypothetical protein
MKREELLLRAKSATAAQFAELVTLVVGLAAETHPEELRRALQNVFDLSCVEQSLERIMQRLQGAHQEALETADKVRQLRRDLERAEARLSMLNRKVPC